MNMTMYMCVCLLINFIVDLEIEAAFVLLLIIN